MPYLRRRFLTFVLFFLAVFIIILLQELIVLDKFEYTFLNETAKVDCKSNRIGDEIDLVYTWVNGSDPHLKNMIKLYQQLNDTDQCADIVQTPFLLVIPQLITSTYDRLIARIPKDDLKQWVPVEYKIEKDQSSSLFFFEDARKAREYLIKKPDELYNYRLYQLHLTKSNCNQTDDLRQIKLKNIFKIDRTLAADEQSKLLNDLSQIFKVNTSKMIKYRFSYKNFDFLGLEHRYDVNGLESLFVEYSKYKIEFGDQEFHFRLITSDLRLTQNEDAYGENRFSDKDELKYSLRSVEKYANWVRNIYIVTNGQVPNWLNTNDPRIRIVNHEEIYPNISHLPTFNSASIENHLHRIKGLSEKFLYLNDDFMFGQPVYLEDFYSRSKGYLIRLGWSAPNCAPNCPTPWLQDGICDKACNSSMCLFDGGDCLKGEKKLMPEIPLNKECKSGCPSIWLADDHCDRQCNNLECGFDLGDCKLDQIDSAFQGVDYMSNQSDYKFNISRPQIGIYLNMTNYFINQNMQKSVNTMQLESSNQMQIRKLKFNSVQNLIFLMLNESTRSRLTYNLTFKLNSDPTNHLISLTLNDRTNAPGRKLMDFYADSLSYSNYIINKKFKIQNRKVPAHMPILLDRNIVERMNVELYDEIEETSSHRFRNSNDLQFAFTYFYFLMSEQYYPTLEQILTEYDRNLDKKLSRNEARTFYLATTKNQFEEKDFELFWNESIICSKNDEQVPVQTLINCMDFDFLSDEVKVRKRNKFVTLKMDDVSFNQIGNDVDSLRSQLDKVRKAPAQFICINDNFSYPDSSKIELVSRTLHDFYESILPLKSRFETNMITINHRSPMAIKHCYKGALLCFIIFCALICLCSRFCYHQTKKKFPSINTI